MSRLDKIGFVAKNQGKTSLLLLSFMILSMILTSLFLSVPEGYTVSNSIRPISIEERQSLVSVLDHLGETLPNQSLTLQNWMNQISEEKLPIVVSSSIPEEIRFNKSKMILSSRFFKQDSLSQQKSLSEAFGMKFDYSKALENSLSRD